MFFNAFLFSLKGYSETLMCPKFSWRLDTAETVTRGFLYLTAESSTSTFLTRIQKQPFANVLQIRCSQKFRNIHRKAPVLEFSFNKVADLRPATLLKSDSNTGVSL